MSVASGNAEVLTKEASGEVPGTLEEEVSGEAGEGEDLNRLGGAYCRSVTSPGLRGYILCFLKPDMILRGVRA